MPRSKIAERIINYLASCGRQEVAMADLFSSVVDGYREGMDMDAVYSRVKAVLQGLVENELVRLSLETMPPATSVPRFIYIRPRMKKTADALMHGQNARSRQGKEGKDENAELPGQGKAKGGCKGRERTEDAVTIRYRSFVDLVEKRGGQVRIGCDWDHLIAMLIYQDMEEYTGFQSCVELFVKGLIWQSRSEQADGHKPSTKEMKAEPRIRPELLGQIDEILRDDAEKYGELKDRNARRKQREDHAPLAGLDRTEIQDFVRCLNQMRDGIHPGELWQMAMGIFFEKLLENETVYDACFESFRAGVLFQMHRKTLEGQAA